MQRFAVGSSVRIVERPELEAFLSAPDPRDRPAPPQFESAGMRTRVVGVRLETAPPLYLLRDVPGLWRSDWLRAA
jgi:hypothetical protein